MKEVEMSCITQHMHSVLTEKIEDEEADRRKEEKEKNETKDTKTYKNQMGTVFRRLEGHCNNIYTRT